MCRPFLKYVLVLSETPQCWDEVIVTNVTLASLISASLILYCNHIHASVKISPNKQLLLYYFIFGKYYIKDLELSQSVEQGEEVPALMFQIYS